MAGGIRVRGRDLGSRDFYSKVSKDPEFALQLVDHLTLWSAECSLNTLLVPLTKNSVTVIRKFRIISVIPPLLTSVTLTDTHHSFVS